MEAIKKKMQAMKLEKDNAMDAADVCEQKSKDANIRAEKAEEEVHELQKKMQQLESDLDVTQEKLLNASQKLEEKEKALLNAEGEVNALNRRIQSLEEDLEKSEERLVVATQKLDIASTAGNQRHSLKTVIDSSMLQIIRIISNSIRGGNLNLSSYPNDKTLGKILIIIYLQVMTPNVCVKYWKIRVCQMRLEWNL